MRSSINSSLSSPLLSRLGIQKPDETSSKASKDEQLEEVEEQKRQKVLRSKQFRDVLWNISDRAGFLVESKLSRILEPYSEKDKCIVRIENIFTVKITCSNRFKKDIDKFHTIIGAYF